MIFMTVYTEIKTDTWFIWLLMYVSMWMLPGNYRNSCVKWWWTVLMWFLFPLFITSVLVSHLCGFSPLCWLPVYMCHIYVVSLPYADHQSTCVTVSLPYADYRSTCVTFMWFLYPMMITTLLVSHLCSFFPLCWSPVYMCHIYVVSLSYADLKSSCLVSKRHIAHVYVTCMWFHRCWTRLPASKTHIRYMLFCSLLCFT